MVHVVYIPGGCTAWCQPLDIAYMRGFKNHLAGESAKHFAADILTNTNVHGIVTTKPFLRSQVTNLVNAAATHTQRGVGGDSFWEDEAPDERPSDVEEEEVPDEPEEEELDVEWLQPPTAAEEEPVPTAPAAAMSKFLALRLVCGTPSGKELATATGQARSSAA
eukprot:183845-Amphidinium_carterae.1